MRVFLAVALVVALASPAAAQNARAQRGLVFVQTHCASCHAVGQVGASPLPIAPPFRSLHTRYPVESLAEAFAEGLTTGHPSMPEFVLDAAQINHVIAYLQTLR